MVTLRRSSGEYVDIISVKLFFHQPYCLLVCAPSTALNSCAFSHAACDQLNKMLATGSVTPRFEISPAIPIVV